MIAIISVTPARTARAEPVTPPENSRKRPSRLGRPIGCRGNVLQFHLTPAAMFIAQATDTPQMLYDVESGPAHMTRERAACRNFPSRVIQKPELNFAAFCQASLAAGIHAMHADVEPARAASGHIFGGKPRRNPVLERETVSMPAKICVH